MPVQLPIVQPRNLPLCSFDAEDVGNGVDGRRTSLYTGGGLDGTPSVGECGRSGRTYQGDSVLAVDEKEIESLPKLQGAVRQHNPGEEIHLRVQRPSGEQVEICVVRPKDVT